MDTITKRELEVAQHIGAGYTYDEIGPMLNISPRTVKAHSDRMRNMLRVKRARMLPAEIESRLKSGLLTVKEGRK